MDRVEVRNLLHHRQLPRNILRPMGYNDKTFKVICEVVEGAMDYEQKKGRARLIKALEEMKELETENHLLRLGFI